MTAPDSTPTVREAGDEGIAAVLVVAHREDASYPNTCVCETEVPDRAEGHYVAHVAAVLAPLIAEREAQAWDKGYTDGLDYMSLPPSVRQVEPENPYRAALAPETPEADA